MTYISQFKARHLSGSTIANEDALKTAIADRPKDLIVNGAELGMAESLALQMNGQIRAMDVMKKNSQYKLTFQWK